MPLYGFTEKDHERISSVVKRVEGKSIDSGYIPKRHQKRSSGGTTISWAKVTAVTDSNNYTCDIYDSRADSEASVDDAVVYVWDIVDSMVANDWFPVQESSVTDKDYECIQQMGAVG